MTPKDCTQRAIDALTELSEREHDFSGALAAVLVQVRNRRGGWEQMERRTGSWESALVERLISGTEPEGGW